MLVDVINCWYQMLVNLIFYCSYCLKLVEEENVKGVITLNEEYETKYFCNSTEVHHEK